MSQNEEREQLKTAISDFITDALLPSRVAQRVAQSLDDKLDPLVMGQAIEGAKKKVRLIMDHIPHMTSEAFLLRIPGPDFLEFVLFSEYVLLNSLHGEKSALRYSRRSREKSGQTMARCLNRLGFFRPEELEPYRRQILGSHESGQATWDKMVLSLAPNQKENPIVHGPESNPGGEDGPAENQHDQDFGAVAFGGEGWPPRRLASVGPKRGQNRAGNKADVRQG